MSRLTLLISLLISSVTLGQVPVGAWRDHISYIRTVSVADAGDRVYCSAGAGLIVFDKKDNSVGKLSRVHGLSDTDISTIEWSAENRMLITGYTNGNIDIIKENRIVNIPDILRSSITGSKRINNIMVAGDRAYLSCNFGIVVLNLERFEVADTYFLGGAGTRLAVNDMEFDGEFLYAATSSGVYRAAIDAPNLIDFSFWERLDFLPDDAAVYTSLAIYEGSLFAVAMDGSGRYSCLKTDDGSWEYFGAPSSVPLTVRSSGGYLSVFSNEVTYIYGQGLSLVRQIDDYGPWSAAFRDVEVEHEGRIWIADRNNGLVRAEGESYNSLVPPGPYSNRVYSISSYPGRTYFAAGGHNAARNNLWIRGEYSIFEEGNYSFRLEEEIRDLLLVKEHPADPGTKYLASWGYGIVEYREGRFHERFTAENSTLRSIIPGDNYIRIGGMAFDKDNNLWVTNSGVTDPVSVRKANGNWVSFPYGGVINHNQAGQIIVNRPGHKWMLLPRGGGLFVFDNDPDSDDRSGDLTRKLSIVDEDNSLISNEVFSIAEDNNGYIWVGTNRGVVVYFNPGRVFTDASFPARRIVVEGVRDEDRGYLLNNETVTAIAVDGADRKWFGTEKSGAFLVSADGREQIYHFTSQNSPLLSNSITDIDIDPSSGEVFFGTSAGVVSYRGTATVGGNTFKNVYAFPNPVRESYSGPITITGLMRDSVVKITDISGNLVYETVSLGGQAVWDGLNARGQRVRTGIYLIFVSSPDGSQSHVTKLMFIH